MSQIKSKKRIKDLAEVYTHEREIENMLEMIPFNEKTKFLEPSCGNGNFLLKILQKKLELVKEKTEKNLLEVLQSLYGIDICSENIIETKKRLLLEFFDFLGKELDISILDKNIVTGNTLQTKIFEDINFDVIIGNPPYQIKDNGAGSSAKPLYHLFVEEAISRNPKYISFIIPSRWMIGGKGLDNFREKFLGDDRIKYITNYSNSRDCFPDVHIEGGVSYFLWDKDYKGKCFFRENDKGINSKWEERSLNKYDIFIKDSYALSILEKVLKAKEFFDTRIFRANFGIGTNFSDFKIEKDDDYNTILYGNKLLSKETKGRVYIKESDIKNSLFFNKDKILISEANGAGSLNGMILSKPFLAEKYSVCSQTYMIVPSEEKEKENILKYMESRVFRFLVSLRKTTQHTGTKVYKFVPIIDFKKDFSEKDFFKEFDISKDEQQYIYSKIKSF